MYNEKINIVTYTGLGGCDGMGTQLGWGDKDTYRMTVETSTENRSHGRLIKKGTAKKGPLLRWVLGKWFKAGRQN
jgi:hypothetical protein